MPFASSPYLYIIIKLNLKLVYSKLYLIILFFPT